MPFIPSPGEIAISIHFTLAGLPISITIVLRNPGGPPSAQELEDAVNAANTWARDTLMDHLSQDTFQTGATGYDLTTESSPVFSVVTSPPVAGLYATNAEFMTSAVVASLRTGNRGRSGRGRNFVPGIPQNVRQDASHVTTQYAADLLGAYLTGATLFALNGFSWVVLSKFTNKQPRTVGFPQEITAFVVNNEVDTKDRTATK